MHSVGIIHLFIVLSKILTLKKTIIEFRGQVSISRSCGSQTSTTCTTADKWYKDTSGFAGSIVTTFCCNDKNNCNGGNRSTPINKSFFAIWILFLIYTVRDAFKTQILFVYK